MLLLRECDAWVGGGDLWWFTFAIICPFCFSLCHFGPRIVSICHWVVVVVYLPGSLCGCPVSKVDTRAKHRLLYGIFIRFFIIFVSDNFDAIDWQSKVITLHRGYLACLIPELLRNTFPLVLLEQVLCHARSAWRSSCKWPRPFVELEPHCFLQGIIRLCSLKFWSVTFGTINVIFKVESRLWKRWI